MIFLKLLKSFRFALRGIAFCVIHEMNMRIHIVATICVLFLAQFFDFTRAEYILLLLTCLAVMALEIINTSIEVLVDKVSPEYSPLAKIAKDTAAGAVILAAIFAVIIGIILFWNPEKLLLAWQFIIQDVWHISMTIGAFCAFYLFIRFGKKRKIKGKK